MGSIRRQIRANTETGIQVLQRCQGSLDVLGIAPVDYVQVACDGRHTLQHRAHAADNNELDVVPSQHTKQREKIKTWHFVPG